LWGFLFYEVFINVNLQENVFRIKEMMGLIVESQDDKVTCDECGWSWKLSEGGDDPYTCHKCGHTNKVNEEEITERCWKGYTQKGMKTMFGKRYPNCVKKTK
jgi:tRNA(Ile2) C34 agmatinyltransferase TiaS